MAKIIVNGEFVEGVGGGVCQVSTTLYNAALVAGMKIVEQHQHSLAVHYVERSFDAMVNSNSSDLKFMNNTPYPIYIAGELRNNSVIFTIYGVQNECKIVRESVVLEEIEAKMNETINSELAEGEKRVIVAAKKGYHSEGYLNYYVGTKLVNRLKIREDRYLAVSGITEVGQSENQN